MRPSNPNRGWSLKGDSYQVVSGKKIADGSMQAVFTRLLGTIAARVFGFTSGVIRNARTFHPDGRTFLGTARSLETSDPSLTRASSTLTGAVLMRVSMGMMKKSVSEWLANRIADVPSISTRFYSASISGEIRLQRREGEDLDILFTAGGDRLWRALWNVATGGRKYGLDQFNYFHNFYYADVPYRVDNGNLDVWLRIATDSTACGATDADGRERGLTSAVARHVVVHVEAQRVGSSREPFVPIAEIRFEKEIEIDQEALHFDPLQGRGFEPHGLLTAMREKAYPASAGKRPRNKSERDFRERDGIIKRLIRYLTPAREK
jgi:hypothetical protein